MPDLSHLQVPSVAASRRRSLVRDVCGCLQQQMFFWGCDAGHRDGNLLVRFGLTRIARRESGGEGSSRYRMDWRDGTVELHSFCAGWYPRFGDGVVFIRSRERLFSFSGAEPLTPGFYEEERQRASTADAMLHNCRPLVEWVAEYEFWVQTNTAKDYRHKCWMRLLSRKGGKPWLPPEEAAQWREYFVTDPGSTPRARELWGRGSKKSRPAFCPATVRDVFPKKSLTQVSQLLRKS